MSARWALSVECSARALRRVSDGCGRRSAAGKRRVQASSSGGCSAALCAPNAKKQGCRRQPCLLSLLDSLYLIQFGFFGFLGSIFPKKLPKWGMGQSPIYNHRMVRARGETPHIYIPSRSEREAEPRIYFFSHGRGMGRSPIYNRHGRGAVRSALLRSLLLLSTPPYLPRSGAKSAALPRALMLSAERMAYLDQDFLYFGP